MVVGCASCGGRFIELHQRISLMFLGNKGLLIYVYVTRPGEGVSFE